jgi:hypothetical protein
MKCHVCGKTLGKKEGFVSNINADGRAVSQDERPIAVCSDACKLEFEESLPMKGRPLIHLSRVTGYMQVVENWNKGKQQEFRDRVRYSLSEI